jgi:DDE family transposase
MSTRANIDHWMRKLLPQAGGCAQKGAACLLRSLLVGFTTDLTQLARQADGDAQEREPSADQETKQQAKAARAKGRRQFFDRWLKRSHWEPKEIYAHLNREARRAMGRGKWVPLLIDFTDLGTKWTVLQVSMPFAGRALPLYRAVVSYTAPEEGRRQLVRGACAFLKEHLPGELSRYVLVADRGFPGHWWVRELTEAGWEFDLRVAESWKLTHQEYTGTLREARALAGMVGPVPRLLRQATLGRRGKGREEWSQANVVLYVGVGQKEPWFLVTSLTSGHDAVAIYRERMKIECEFRDLKGPFGLDLLARWQNRERVARFLAMVAIYEWRLAHLWLVHQLREWGAGLVKHGRLSWIRITREWIQSQIRLAAQLALASL